MDYYDIEITGAKLRDRLFLVIRDTDLAFFMDARSVCRDIFRSQWVSFDELENKCPDARLFAQRILMLILLISCRCK